MKTRIAGLVLWALVLAFPLMAQTRGGGVQFRGGPMNSLLEAARKANKPLFIEIYSPTSHVCQSFIPIFEEKRVGTFYNSKFISGKLDIANRETVAFLEKNKLYIPALPFFLYYSPQGKLVHVAQSNNIADEVIRHGTDALSPASQSLGMRQRYEKGERSSNFLIDYGLYAKVTRDTATNIRVMNDYVRQIPANSYASQTNWLVLQKLIMDVDNPLFQYMLGHLDQYLKYGADQVRSTAENILMSSLYSSRGSQYPVAKILAIRDGLQKIGIDPKVAANRTLLPEIYAYFRADQSGRAASRMDSHSNQSSFTLPEYLYVIRLFNGRSPDAADAPTVVNWTNKALTLARLPKEQADVYYEQAEAYHRAGKSADALRAAQKALELARAAQMDTRRNTLQLDRLK